MITGALQDLHKPPYVIPLEDINRNVLWVSPCPCHDATISPDLPGNPLVIRLFHEAGIEVLSPAMYERATLSGTKIRDLIACDKPWEDFVPPAVVRVIQEIDGISRIRALNQDDGDCPGR